MAYSRPFVSTFTVSIHEDRRQDLRHEPDARMVEIGVYSTVGTSEVYCRHYAECRRESEAKVWWKSPATAVERAENGVKDVVKMVACNAHCKNSP